MVLPIRNEANFIAKTIKQLQEQVYPRDRLEILVVVGYSHDNTAAIVQEIAAQDERVRYLHNPKLWSSSARNIGAKEATGDIITYIDGHTYIDNDQLLINIARLIAEKEVSVLSRPQFLDTPENTTFQKAVSLARKSALGHGLDSTIYSDEDMYVNPTSAGASYKREVFDKVGYFDEQFDASEDYEFNYRVAQAGYRAFTSLQLAVYYYPRKSFGTLFKQMTRYGTGDSTSQTPPTQDRLDEPGVPANPQSNRNSSANLEHNGRCDTPGDQYSAHNNHSQPEQSLQPARHAPNKP